jgi:hypothetical protein
VTKQNRKTRVKQSVLPRQKATNQKWQFDLTKKRKTDTQQDEEDTETKKEI